MNRSRRSIRGVADSLLDLSVIGGYSRLGYEVRSRTQQWVDVDEIDVRGKSVAVTGATSGLGLATTTALRSMGADVIVIGRSPSKLHEVTHTLVSQPSVGAVHSVVCDLGDLESVRRASIELATSHRIDVLVHNAGALSKERMLSPQGFESTVATHVLGPFLMTSLLAPRISTSVITVSSGGMYAAPIPAFDRGHSLELPESAYNGTRQYAIAKRAQVTLSEMWAASRPTPAFFAMHPGWADTPGVQDSLPAFRLVTRPFLRSPDQGADTVVWLASLGSAHLSLDTVPTGSFVCDRAVRPIHRLGSTRRSDTASSRAALWEWCTERVSAYSGDLEVV